MMWISSSFCKFFYSKSCVSFVCNKCNWVTDFFFLWILFFLANGLLAIVVRQLEKSEH